MRPSIRPFQPADREPIRQLCCRTAALDRPLESFFPDPRLFADLMTRYYLEREPGSTLVARAQDGSLVGYLLACRDSRRQRRWQALWYGPRALLAFVLRGGLLRARTWRLARANLPLLRPAPGGGVAESIDEYPAHLHLAVLAGQRGRGVGSALLRELIGRLREADASGVHAVVREENRRARRFFERAGFVPLGRRRALRRPPEAAPAWKITYGRKL